MEFMPMGSVDNVIHDPSVAYGRNEVFSWMLQISLGLGHLHEEGIIHRDIKPKNLLLGETHNVLKISDFGTARPIGPLDKDSLTTCVGSPLYMAPEVIEYNNDRIRYSYPSDIYSLSITLWEISTRQIPYSHLGMSGISLLLMITRGERPQMDNFPLPPEFGELIRRGWDQTASSRPTNQDFLDYATRNMASRTSSGKTDQGMNLELDPLTGNFRDSLRVAAGNTRVDQLKITAAKFDSTNDFHRYLLYFGTSGMLFYTMAGIVHSSYLIPTEYSTEYAVGSLLVNVFSLFQVLAQTATVLHRDMIDNDCGYWAGITLWVVNFIMFCLDLFDAATLGIYSNPVPKDSSIVNVAWTMFVRGLGPFDVFYRFHSLAVIAENIEHHIRERDGLHRQRRHLNLAVEDHAD